MIIGRPDENTVFVDSGEVKVCQGKGVLRASAIGSCVVVTAYDQDLRVGGMAHIMLPRASRDPDSPGKLKYAEDAMQELMRKMADFRADKAKMLLCLIGGGNLLGKGRDSLGLKIAQSLIEIHHKMGIKPVAMDLGGTQRRSCVLDVTCGRVTFTVGDSAQRTLWEARTSKSR